MDSENLLTTSENLQDDDKYIIDKYYIITYKFIKYTLFVISTYLIIYFTLKEEENDTPYNVILLLVTLISILFYIVDTNFPISNV